MPPESGGSLAKPLPGSPEKERGWEEFDRRICQSDMLICIRKMPKAY